MVTGAGGSGVSITSFIYWEMFDDGALYGITAGRAGTGVAGLTM